ncbi:MAG: DUF4167 domain-containing protein, partial [Caulobacteraceae bacterium]|nr:DUF4167 domain-containing protein [Caulobacteraceae bacterium]
GEAEGAVGQEAAGERQDRVEPRRDERPRDDYRPADQRPRDDRAQNGRAQGDRVQNDRSQNAPRDDRSGRDFREERPRTHRDERPRFESADRADPLGVIEPRATPLTVPAQAGAAGPVLRADDGEVNHAPAFLQVRPAEPRADASAETRPPRRRRPPRSFEAADAGQAPASSDET